MYTCNWFTLSYSRNQHNIVKQLYPHFFFKRLSTWETGAQIWLPSYLDGGEALSTLHHSSECWFLYLYVMD